MSVLILLEIYLNDFIIFFFGVWGCVAIWRMSDSTLWGHIFRSEFPVSAVFTFFGYIILTFMECVISICIFCRVIALLSGTLRTIQRAACDGETLTLRCPMGTAVSIQLAQYGRPAPGVSLCPGKDSSHASNDSCTLNPSMQVRKSHRGDLMPSNLI